MLESTLMLEVKTNKNPKGQSLIITLTFNFSHFISNLYIKLSGHLLSVPKDLAIHVTDL